MLGNWIRCDEEEHCYFQELKGKNNDKYCRILVTLRGEAPYKSGKCPFHKYKETDKSGCYRKEPSANGSPEKGES